MLDYIRIACAVPRVRVGDVAANCKAICEYIVRADEQGADVLLLPEMSLTGYSCQDLFYQDTLQEAAYCGLNDLCHVSKKHPGLTVVVGLPVRIGIRLLNCAAVVRDGTVYGLIPKCFPGSGDANGEKRWFSSGAGLEEQTVTLGPVGTAELTPGGIFILGDGAKLAVEMGDDPLAPLAPSTGLVLQGAEVILNPCAATALAGRRTKRADALVGRSGMLNCVYASCSAGGMESTQDVVYSGDCLIGENGRILRASCGAIQEEGMILADCDLGILRSERRKNAAFQDSAASFAGEGCRVTVSAEIPLRGDGAQYPLRKLPFIPDEKAEREYRCREIFGTQVAALKQRLRVIGNPNAVIGISGGLDSTLALLVAVEAMLQLGRPASDVYGVTMPCYGTSDRTYRNAWELMKQLGITSKEINIRQAVTSHFADIGHDASVHNGTYENSQARERTQILMDYSSVVGGIVIGTGDLSELALGWCTYNGDHMSMYGVNGTVPKTLIRWIIETVSQEPAFLAARETLMDILDTPISPELLPPDAQGQIAQYTEDLVGPYALHDFFLFYLVRYGFRPKKILALAQRAFANDFDELTIRKWLRAFLRRFFTQQFKRNCMPDGVKVGSVSLGPRGDWHMPSDASAALWLKEIDEL